MSDQLLPANPLLGLGRELFGRTRRGLTRKVRALGPVQLKAFLQAARGREDTFPAVALMALTGMRLGEAAAQRWEDVDWTTSRISVARQLYGTLKTPESERGVDLPRALLDLLRDLRAQCRETAFRQGRAPSPGLLFPDLPEQPTAKDATRIVYRVRLDMERALKAAGLPPSFTPHSLRHTYASRLISDDVLPKDVRRQLGHANIGITLDLYGRWLPMAPPEGALDKARSALCGPECNERRACSNDSDRNLRRVSGF